jgi:hypothetical protein
MDAWEQLRDQLKRRLGLRCERPDWLGLEYGGRRFLIERTKAACPRMISVETVYLRSALLTPTAALARNRTAPVGALYRDADNYVARQQLPLEKLSFGAVEDVMRALSVWADAALPPALRRPPEAGALSRLFAGIAD